jgi:hypothetical protein
MDSQEVHHRCIPLLQNRVATAEEDDPVVSMTMWMRPPGPVVTITVRHQYLTSVFRCQKTANRRQFLARRFEIDLPVCRLSGLAAGPVSSVEVK